MQFVIVADNQMAIETRREELTVVYDDEYGRVLGALDVGTVLQAVIGKDRGSK